MNHKLNIIIPTKDRAETLIWAIKSCLQNNYSHFSIIVSDNASTDNTEEVVMSLSNNDDNFVDTVQQTENVSFTIEYDDGTTEERTI